MTPPTKVCRNVDCKVIEPTFYPRRGLCKECYTKQVADRKKRQEKSITLGELSRRKEIADIQDAISILNQRLLELKIKP